MKKKLLHIALATALLPVFTGCIGNFEEYNTNPYEPHKLDPPLLFTQMITTGINVQQNDNQMIDQMVAGPYGGYLTMSLRGEGLTLILITRQTGGIKFLSTHRLKNSIPTTIRCWMRQVGRDIILQWLSCFVSMRCSAWLCATDRFLSVR